MRIGGENSPQPIFAIRNGGSIAKPNPALVSRERTGTSAANGCGEECIMSKGIYLGTGVLTWEPVERQSDRYGSVWLADKASGDDATSVISTDAQQFADVEGKLRAIVKETRISQHIGDLFRGIFPRTPKVGDIIILGSGVFFWENTIGRGIAVGLRPHDGRSSDWLSPRSLYDCHHQTVALFFDADVEEDT
jgi:hypothetical protein